VDGIELVYLTQRLHARALHSIRQEWGHEPAAPGWKAMVNVALEVDASGNGVVACAVDHFAGYALPAADIGCWYH
jgi:hypothetical protein